MNDHPASRAWWDIGFPGGPILHNAKGWLGTILSLLLILWIVSLAGSKPTPPPPRPTTTTTIVVEGGT